MDLETLRAINLFAAIVLPMWVIGPLMRRRSRYRIILAAIFCLMLGSQYIVLVCVCPPESALLRAIGLAALMMTCGYIWARITTSNGQKISWVSH